MKKKTVLGLLVLALAVAVVGFAVAVFSRSNVPGGWESARVMSCEKQKSYVQETELYGYEKGDYSDNAKAYRILDSHNRAFKIIFDFSKGLTGNGYNFKASLLNIADRKLNLGGAVLKLKTDDQDITLNPTSNQSIVEPGSSIVFNSSNQNIKQNSKLSLEIRQGKTCISRVLESLDVSSLEQSTPALNEGVFVGTESATINVPSGFSAIGFSDWRGLESFRNMGVKVLSYNRESSRMWSEIEGDQKSVLEPGVGYYLENDSDSTISVKPDEPFKVPSNVSSHTMRKGWNIFYNDMGRTTSISDFKVTIGSTDYGIHSFKSKEWKLGELIDSKIVSPQIFKVSKFLEGSFPAMNPFGLEENSVNEGEVFWVYLFDEPDFDTLSSPNLDFSMKLDKESYKTGETVRISYKITNLSDSDIILDKENQEDPCQYGFVALKGKKVVSSTLQSSISSCPKWPDQINLPPGSLIEYNQTWEIPADVSGEIRLVGYLDQSRIFSKDRKSTQVVINVKEDE